MWNLLVEGLWIEREIFKDIIYLDKLWAYCGIRCQRSLKSQPCFFRGKIGMQIPHYWMDERWVLRLVFLFFSPSFCVKFFLWSSILLPERSIILSIFLVLTTWHIFREPTIKAIKIIADIKLIDATYRIILVAVKSEARKLGYQAIKNGKSIGSDSPL